METDMLPPLMWTAPIPPEIFQQAIGTEQLGVPFDGNQHGLVKVPANAVVALISIEGADIRFTETGDSITNATGVRLTSGSVVTFYSRRTLQSLQFASVGPGTATLNVIYYLLKTPDLEDLLTVYPGLP